VKKIPASAIDIRRAAIAALESERSDSALLSIAFLGKQAMTSLNAKYLRKRRPTDVIAFSFQNPAGGSATVGDIYICPEVARVNARKQGVTAKEEIRRLVVHGVLHTLGHDHPEGENRVSSGMWRRQEEILASLR
jgi:probable rRNA maturation factor